MKLLIMQSCAHLCSIIIEVFQRYLDKLSVKKNTERRGEANKRDEK
jgi:hypothetical protein